MLQPLPKTGNWNTISTPFRPFNITAQGGNIWVCGADEMILSSTDGGGIWATKHQSRDGEESNPSMKAVESALSQTDCW
jgi:photosystem II stability/assembly factor-like uncharacterized protein